MTEKQYDFTLGKWYACDPGWLKPTLSGIKKCIKMCERSWKTNSVTIQDFVFLVVNSAVFWINVWECAGCGVPNY